MYKRNQDPKIDFLLAKKCSLQCLAVNLHEG